MPPAADTRGGRDGKVRARDGAMIGAVTVGAAVRMGLATGRKRCNTTRWGLAGYKIAACAQSPCAWLMPIQG